MDRQASRTILGHAEPNLRDRIKRIRVILLKIEYQRSCRQDSSRGPVARAIDIAAKDVTGFDRAKLRSSRRRCEPYCDLERFSSRK